MKIYGDTISPFVRMCLVAAHECGLSSKLEHVKEAVKPTQANPKLTALSALEVFGGQKIVRDPSVNQRRAVINLTKKMIPRREAVELLREALRSKGIVLEPTADGRLLARAVSP